MKDFLGKEINIGDEVVFMELKYRTLSTGFIKKITEHKCLIVHAEDNLYRKENWQFHNQIVKINKEPIDVNT